MSLQTPLNNTVNGTILAGGTLTSEMNIQGYTLIGLMATTSSVNGTLGFQVSDKPTVPVSPDQTPGVYRTLYTNLGVPVSVTAPSGAFAISSDALTPLKGYQYVKVSSTAQTTGLAITLILKTE